MMQGYAFQRILVDRVNGHEVLFIAATREGELVYVQGCVDSEGEGEGGRAGEEGGRVLVSQLTPWN